MAITDESKRRRLHKLSGDKPLNAAVRDAHVSPHMPACATPQETD